jgi:hypothetical protein
MILGLVPIEIDRTIGYPTLMAVVLKIEVPGQFDSQFQVVIKAMRLALLSLGGTFTFFQMYT